MECKTLSSTLVIAAVAALAASQPAGAAAKSPSAVPGADAYQTAVTVVVNAGASGSTGNSVDPVPADRRLVMEFVSVMALVPTGQKPRVELIGLVDGAGLPFAIPLTFVGQFVNGFDEYRSTQQVRVYHDGNGSNGPRIVCSRNLLTGPATCNAWISGYLIGK